QGHVAGACAPNVAQRAERDQRRQDENRSDEKRREVVMAELRAAECRALRDRGEDREDEQRVVELIEWCALLARLPPKGAPEARTTPALDEVHERDGDRERTEDEMELLHQHEVGERVEIEIAAERGDEIGERQRPRGINDARNDHE